MKGFLVELAAQIQPGLGRVDVLVEAEHEVVGNDRVAGGEERHEASDQVGLGRAELVAQVRDVTAQVDLFDDPRVADGGPVVLVELRVPHRPQRQVEARVQDRPSGRVGVADRRVRRGSRDLGAGRGVDGFDGAHQSQASQVSGFSREQVIASESV